MELVRKFKDKWEVKWMCPFTCVTVFAIIIFGGFSEFYFNLEHFMQKPDP